MARLLLGLLIVLAPLAAAVPDTPEEIAGTEVVTSWSIVDDFVWCGSWDPALALASTSLASTVTRTPRSGTTAYDLHLAAAPASGCADFDLAFEAPLAAWPGSAPLSSACGASGAVAAIPEAGSTWLYVDAYVPAACGAGHDGDLSIRARVQPAHPETALVCAPVEGPTGPICAGAYEDMTYGPCSFEPRFSVVAGVELLVVRESCNPANYEPRHVVSVGPFGTVVVFAPEGSCAIRAGDPLGLTSETVECPAEVSDAVRAAPWFDTIP